MNVTMWEDIVEVITEWMMKHEMATTVIASLLGSLLAHIMFSAIGI